MNPLNSAFCTQFATVIVAAFALTLAGCPNCAPYVALINPDHFGGPIDNLYFPLSPGTTFTYEKVTGEGIERAVVTVTREKKTILDVECTVVRDTVTLDGELFDIAVRARKDAGLGQLPSNLEVIIEDPRGYAVSSHEPVDLIVIASPEPSTRAAGRMFSVEFLGQLAPKLAGDGALPAFVHSGESAVIGDTLRYGQSIWQTFSSVFANVAVVPGEEAVILAGHKEANLTTNSGELAQRYLAFTGGKGPYDPRRFSELVQDDRATFVKDAYQANTQQMIHSDTRPLSSFLAMLTSFLLERQCSPRSDPTPS